MPHGRLQSVVFEAGTVSHMFSVELVARLGARRRLTDDEVTDVIETIVDDLDRLLLEASVGTVRVDEDIEITVSETVDEPEQFDALTRGVTAARAAFHAAGIGTAGLIVPRDLRTCVTPMKVA